MHILNVYLEPGQESFVIKRAEMVINLAKDIVKQDAGAKIIINPKTLKTPMSLCVVWLVIGLV